MKSGLEKLALDCWERGCTWIGDHLDLFLPADRIEPEHMKAITELAMFYGFTVPWLEEHGRSYLHRIRDFLVQFLSDPVLSQWVRKQPGSYTPYMLAYLALRGTGVRLPEFEYALTAVRRAGYPHAIEATPYREMELQHADWKAGLSRRRPNWGAALRRTTLGRAKNPVYFSTAEVYSITHTLFYITDFAGTRANVPTRERRRVIEMIEPLLVYFWRQPDWDVTAELLLNLVALDRADSQIFDAAFAALARAWRPDGALPGPHFVSREMNGDAKLIFKHCYHTTIVGEMLCAAYHYRTSEKSKERATA